MGSIRVFISLLLLGCFSLSASAQTFSEWFRQKKTQEKYLIEQIAALQVYIGYAKKGYKIAGSGLGMVRDITGGEFKLHELFISGLKKAAPAIKADARVAEIILLETEILRAFAALMQMDISPSHLDYLLSVKAAVVEESLDDLEELLLVVTSGKVEMTDDQRLTRLNAIHLRMRSKAEFVQSFTGEIMLLLRAKEKEKKSIDRLRRYYGID